ASAAGSDPADARFGGLDPHQVRVQTTETGVRGVADQLEELREEVPVDVGEVRPPAQVLARVGDALPLDGQGPQRQLLLDSQDHGQVGSIAAGPGADLGEDLAAGQGGDVI